MKNLKVCVELIITIRRTKVLSIWLHTKDRWSTSNSLLEYLKICVKVINYFGGEGGGGSCDFFWLHTKDEEVVCYLFVTQLRPHQLFVSQLYKQGWRRETGEALDGVRIVYLVMEELRRRAFSWNSETEVDWCEQN